MLKEGFLSVETDSLCETYFEIMTNVWSHLVVLEDRDQCGKMFFPAEIS